MSTCEEAESSAGNCLCGAIQFEIRGKPETTIVCHCDSCQKVSGSAFMVNCWFKTSNLKIISGDDQLQEYENRETFSGLVLKRSFCRVCGSNMFLQNQHLKDMGFISITTGTIEKKEHLLPAIEFFSRNRRPWVSEIPTTEKNDAQ
ncbi:DUF636 domain protein [Penicillium lagena]|uniref:DUF636 domain protein n=1 Tax=Penicillium lagena TaxID=94218 RepID=UPI00253FA843|nr:DUF636 domain protein [Penicillium lagena]KAJ5613427.1 DUF636 domain protein [Penicillium lagena]